MRTLQSFHYGPLLLFAMSPGLTAGARLTVFPEGSLSGMGLSSACEATLYQGVSCAEEALPLMGDVPIGSFGDSKVTELVCRPVCERTIRHMRDKVALACDEEEMIPGLPYVRLFDRFGSNWNQSCFNDPDSGKNCNGEPFYPMQATMPY